MLSNGDPETAKAYHKIPFDQVISVTEANAFKPHVATYTKAAKLAGKYRALTSDVTVRVAHAIYRDIVSESADAVFNRQTR